MKRFLYTVLAASAVLATAACVREQQTEDPEAQYVDVTFQVGFGDMQTKAFADGKAVSLLRWLVYQDLPTPKFVFSGSKTGAFAGGASESVTLRLVKGLEYKVVFWAQNPAGSSAYTIDETWGTLTVNLKGLKANDDKRDAFYAVAKVLNPTSVVAVELKRPFAQINVLTTDADWTAANENGITVVRSDMTVKAPVKMDLVHNQIDDTSEADYVFAPDLLPTTEIPSFATGYKYVAMNYVLPPSGNTTVNFNIYKDATSTITVGSLRSVPNVPLKTNYRTNIVGSLYSVLGTFTVTLDASIGTGTIYPVDAVDPTIDASALGTGASDAAVAVEYNAAAGTGSATLPDVGSTLDFGSVKSDFAGATPTYTSSNTAVGDFAPGSSVFTAKAAGTTDVTVHFNAVMDGTEITKSGADLREKDVVFKVTVVGGAFDGIKATNSKPNYNLYERFDTTLIAVKALFKGVDTTTPLKPNEYTVDTTKYNNKAVGAYDIVVRYVKDANVTDTVKVNVLAPVQFTTIAGLNGLVTTTSADYYGQLSNAVVSFVPAANTAIIKDASGSILYYKSGHGLKQGQTFTGDVKVTAVQYNSLYSELTAIDASFTGEEAAVAPQDVTLAQLTGNYSTYQNAYVKLSDVQVTAVNGKNVTVKEGDNTYIVYTNFTNTVAVNDVITATGTVTKYGTTEEIKVWKAADLTVGASAPAFGVAKTSISVDAAATSATINVTGNVAWTASSSDATVAPASGEGAGAITVTFDANTSTTEDKTYTVTVSTTADVTTKSYDVTITQAKASGSGSSDKVYQLYSGELTEGDYVIYYVGKAMKNTVASDRLQFADVTPFDGTITNPDASIVWHVAKSGDYWTIYSADVQKYAASTGVKNKAALLADGTDDKAKWTVTGTSTYDFTNKQNAASNVNATLRNNGTYGFACYATGTGGALTLYKLAE